MSGWSCVSRMLFCDAGNVTVLTSPLGIVPNSTRYHSTRPDRTGAQVTRSRSGAESDTSTVVGPNTSTHQRGEHNHNINNHHNHGTEKQTEVTHTGRCRTAEMPPHLAEW